MAPDPDDAPVEPVDPDAILRRPFPTVRRGYDPLAVQTYLMAIAASLREARERERAAQQRAEEAESRLAALRSTDGVQLTEALGEETARVLEAANAAAAEIRERAQQSAARMLRQARAEAVAVTDEAQRQARELVSEASEVRERMLRDLARRRKALRVQVEQLQAGRDRLLVSLAVVRETLDAVTAELEAVLPDARAAAAAAARRAAMVDDESAIERALAASRRARPASRPTPGPPPPVPRTSRPTSTDVPTVATEVATVPAATGAAAGRQSPGAARARTATPAAAEPVPKAPDPVEGRHSSAVRVIRPRSERDPSIAPPQEPAGDDPVAVSPSPSDHGVGTAAAAGAPGRAPRCTPSTVPERVDGEEAPPDGDDSDRPVEDASGTTAARVASLFARIREDAAQGPAGPVTPAVEATGDRLTAAEDPSSDEEPLERAVARLLKRELTTELNEVLDAARTGSAPVVEELLPAPEAHVGRYASVVAPCLSAAGVAEADRVAAELAAAIVGPLRTEVGRALADAAGAAAPDAMDEGVPEALRACFRRVKLDRVDAAVARAVPRPPSGSPATAAVR